MSEFISDKDAARLIGISQHRRWRNEEELWPVRGLTRSFGLPSLVLHAQELRRSGPWERNRQDFSLFVVIVMIRSISPINRTYVFRRGPTREDVMITMKSPWVQQTLVAMTLFAAIGALSVVWPAIIALGLSVFLLFHSLGAGQEIVLLSGTEVSQMSILFTSLQRPGLLAILS